MTSEAYKGQFDTGQEILNVDSMDALMVHKLGRKQKLTTYDGFKGITAAVTETNRAIQKAKQR